MLKEWVQAWCARENRRERETLDRDAAGGIQEATGESFWLSSLRGVASKGIDIPL